MNQIIVGVDGSAGAARALRWACEEADRRDWPVTALLAFERHATDDLGLDEVWTDGDARKALDAYVLEALGPVQAEDVAREVRRGLPGPTLVEAATDASLLVVGARGHGTLERLLVGSVGEYCVHHAPCPVAVIRASNERVAGTRRRIVAGVDGSDDARAALEWAIADAATDHAELEIVHSWSFPYAGTIPFGYAADLDVFEDAARANLDAVVAGASLGRLQEPVQRRLVMGGAAAVLLDAAKQADLLVVGSRGRGGFRELLLGSVSHQVTHHATCPVVVVPHDRRS